MTNYWFISDTHFNHKNIFEFKNNDNSHLRPFSSVDEMNEVIIENWNKLIKPRDKVYHLGDVIFGSPKDFHKILSRLNGKKRLVLGNHDCDKQKHLFPYFEKIHGVRHLDIKGFKCILSHIPLHPECIERFGVNIHGHLHCNNIYGNTWKEEGDEELQSISVVQIKHDKYINVCVEQTDYKPINLEEIK